MPTLFALEYAQLDLLLHLNQEDDYADQKGYASLGNKQNASIFEFLTAFRNEVRIEAEQEDSY